MKQGTAGLAWPGLAWPSLASVLVSVFLTSPVSDAEQNASKQSREAGFLWVHKGTVGIKTICHKLPLCFQVERGAMESSGRCRRTDGKRWRCSKDAIPNEKYCQTHMHRGCRRGSRKLVESEPKTTPNLNLTLPAKDSSAKDPSKDQDSSGKDPSKTQDSSAVKRDKVTTVKLKMMNHEQEFSPKSVLGEGSREGGCPDEARRCRRTDGKRWRCTKEVIGEGQKYCANHMYRGAKKHCQDNASNPYALVKRENHTLSFAFHSP